MAIWQADFFSHVTSPGFFAGAFLFMYCVEE
jgi:hypothetical protein